MEFSRGFRSALKPSNQGCQKPGDARATEGLTRLVSTEPQPDVAPTELTAIGRHR